MRAAPKLSDCPKWISCSAPICPLDSEWDKREMMDDERICFYLLESQKSGAELAFHQRDLDDLYLAMVSMKPTITAKRGRIRRHLERAEGASLRMSNIPPWRKYVATEKTS